MEHDDNDDQDVSKQPLQEQEEEETRTRTPMMSRPLCAFLHALFEDNVHLADAEIVVDRAAILPDKRSQSRQLLEEYSSSVSSIPERSRWDSHIVRTSPSALEERERERQEKALVSTPTRPQRRTSFEVDRSSFSLIVDNATTGRTALSQSLSSLSTLQEDQLCKKTLPPRVPIRRSSGRVHSPPPANRAGRRSRSRTQQQHEEEGEGSFHLDFSESDHNEEDTAVPPRAQPQEPAIQQPSSSVVQQQTVEQQDDTLPRRPARTRTREDPSVVVVQQQSTEQQDDTLPRRPARTRTREDPSVVVVQQQSSSEQVQQSSEQDDTLPRRPARTRTREEPSVAVQQSSSEQDDSLPRRPASYEYRTRRIAARRSFSPRQFPSEANARHRRTSLGSALEALPQLEGFSNPPHPRVLPGRAARPPVAGGPALDAEDEANTSPNEDNDNNHNTLHMTKVASLRRSFDVGDNKGSTLSPPTVQKAVRNTMQGRMKKGKLDTPQHNKKPVRQQTRSKSPDVRRPGPTHTPHYSF